MVTINQIRKYFSDFADGHFQIKDFGYGDFPDVSMEQGTDYPLMWVQPLPWTVSGNEISMPYKVAIADRVYKERGEQETEVHSDTALIALDLLASMNQQQDYDWELNQETSATPFTEAWKDEVAGHMVDVTFKIQWNYDACQIPQSGQPDPPPSSCAGVIITINGTLFATPASGDTEAIEVRDANGTLVGSLVGGIWVVPAAGANATAVLKNTAGTTISTTSIASGASQDITAPDATAVLKNSLNVTITTEAIPSNVTENIPVADVSWTDSDGTPQSTPYGNAIVCTPSTPPSGVLLKWPTGSQYASFQSGDEGWRMQNGYFDYTPPTNPEVIAEIDSSIGQNGWLRLKNPLVVGGVSSVIRFVGINGLQDWPSTDNLDKITIDKLTGIGFYRIAADIDPVANWSTVISNALTFSVVVNGVTYSTWYAVSLEEILLMFYHKVEQASGHIEDLISAGQPDIYVKPGTGTELWTSTTQANSTTNAYSRGWSPEAYVRGVAKSATFMPFYVFDARSLITAP